MLGKPVSVLERVSEKGGRVFVEGEYWNALSETAIEPGEPAETVSIEGLTLRIRAKQPQN
jgi:membrane-bound serine protease (ClpP class)